MKGSKYDVYAELISAGVQAGFKVVPEFRVKPSLEAKSRFVDLTWCIDNPNCDSKQRILPVAAFEIEGHDVELRSDGEINGIQKDADSLLACARLLLPHLADLLQVVPSGGQEPPHGAHGLKTERLQRAEDGRLRLELGVFNNWNTDPASDTSAVERWVVTTDLVDTHTAERLVRIETGRHSYGGGGQDQERLSDGTLLVAYVEGWDSQFYPDLTLGVHDDVSGFRPVFTVSLEDADGLFEPYSVGLAVLH